MKTEESKESEETPKFKHKREPAQCDGCGNPIPTYRKMEIVDDHPARLCRKCLNIWNIYGSGTSLEGENEQRTFAKT